MKKRVKRKNCARVCEYTFLIFVKGDTEKNCVRFEKYTFLILEKGEKQKRFVGFFKICKYTF